MSWSSVQWPVVVVSTPLTTRKGRDNRGAGLFVHLFLLLETSIHGLTHTHTHLHLHNSLHAHIHSNIYEKSTYTQDCVIYFIYSSGSQSQVQAPQGFLEWIPRGPQRKGESFIFTVIPAISKTMTERTTISVMGFVQLLYIKDLKEKFLSVEGPNSKSHEMGVHGLICVNLIWSNLCPWHKKRSTDSK